GAVWSRVKVDPVRLVGDPVINGIHIFQAGQILQLDDIESILGRASVRLGANFTDGFYSWQPFISASVIHEFAGNLTSRSTAVDPVFVRPEGNGGLPLITSTERFGTYGQFGLGSAIVVGDTGWLGYGRADVKFGENIQGFGVNVG